METTLVKLLKPYRLAFIIYPIYTIVALNYADFFLTSILVLNGWDTEANPIVLATGGVFAPFNMFIKLIVAPLISIFVWQPIYLRLRNQPRIGRPVRMTVSLVLIFYFIIVALNLGDALYHMGLP